MLVMTSRNDALRHLRCESSGEVHAQRTDCTWKVREPCSAGVIGRVDFFVVGNLAGCGFVGA